MCAGTDGDCDPRGTLRANGTARFPTTNGDFRLLLEDADLIQHKVLPYILLVSACFFGLEVVCLILDLIVSQKPQRLAFHKFLAVVELVSAYVSLFLVIAAASEVTFALSGLALGNTLGEPKVQVNTSVRFQALHWTLAVFSLLFHMMSSALLDLHGPLVASAHNFSQRPSLSVSATKIILAMGYLHPCNREP
jgi:hypothetical protein